ncbi:phage tail assembly chaperone family protein, TAC [uncultured Pseudomonas sp.]|uniref:phage tail assembly chaperone family protein, TAC n=1 Tax=uncultured Pseudomonas sp. TaxID=114707 RepID=UPI0025FA3F1C|nr:phage tail assembly chaperone family protein, TAC [uncultured Pseudomonas sp.]
MKLKELKAAGAFVEAAPVKKPIKWPHLDENGDPVTDEFTVLVKRQSFAVIENLYSPDAGEGEADVAKRSRNAKLISECVLLGEKGEEQIPYEDARNLEPNLAFALLNAVHEVNGLGKTAAKN